MLFTISGPSCAGKSRLLTYLRHIHDIVPLVSYTTRQPRDSDKDSGEYRFVSDSVFQQMVTEDEFVWHVMPHGLPYRYGTRRKDLAVALTSLDPFAAILTLDAVRTVHRLALESCHWHNVWSIYLHIDNEMELRRRFAEDSRTDVESRLDYAKWNDEALGMVSQMCLIDAMRAPHDVLGRAMHYFTFHQCPSYT